MGYKEMYEIMVSETEKAINTLIEAQQKCEEIYISSSEKPADEPDNPQ